MPSSAPIRLVFDMEERRPMCAIIQALHTDDYLKVSRFNAESWLISSTDKMALVELTPEQFERVVKVMNVRFPMKKLGRTG